MQLSETDINLNCKNGKERGDFDTIMDQRMEAEDHGRAGSTKEEKELNSNENTRPQVQRKSYRDIVLSDGLCTMLAPEEIAKMVVEEYTMDNIISEAREELLPPFNPKPIVEVSL